MHVRVGARGSAGRRRVGYPPFLYTDVLSCVRLEQPVRRKRDGQVESTPHAPGWWIVAKSSVNEPFLADDAAAAAAATAAAAPAADDRGYSESMAAAMGSYG